MSSKSEQTAAELADLTLDDFKTWTTVNLKAFLHLRGKNSEGGHESLAAKAFSVWCDKVPVNPELEHNEKCIWEEYKAKLVINKDIVIPDPLTLKSGWIGEVKGIQNWPSSFYTDIANLLSLTQPDFNKCLESEYRQGKAYRYFSCEFVREIYINELNKETPVCILKCKVIPSQRINSRPYDVWAVVQKNKPNEPGGYIHSAYCTCTAGILGTCNHVTGMLFRIENAVQTGLTTPSKTSLLCTWNIPKGQRVDTTVKPVRDLVFEKSVYTNPKSKSVKLANDKKEYSDFSPAVTNQEKLKDKENLRNSLFTILEKDIPSSCFALSMKSKMTVTSSSMEPQTPPVDSPETVKQLTNKYTYNESNTLLQNLVEFTRSLNVSKNQIEHLKI